MRQALRQWMIRAAGLFHRKASDQRIGEEAEFHLAMLEEQYVRQGMKPADARLAARRDFGGVTQVREQYRDQSLLPSVESLRSDILFALRSFRKTPAVTLLIIGTLGLGIGANTAIFSYLNEILIRPLPFHDPDTLIHIGRDWRGESGATAPRDFFLIRDKAKTVNRVATMFLHRGENVETPGMAQYITGIKVSKDYFAVLGIQPLLGRTFTAEEDAPNGPKAVLLSHDLWMRAFQGNREVAGKSIKIGGVPHEIIGVMPETIETNLRARLWLSLQTTGMGRDTNYTTIARLAPGVTAAQAASEVEALFREQERQDPNRPRGSREDDPLSRVIPLHELEASEFRQPVLVLYAGVCVVLFVACINVANLLLARSAARSREIAVRAALGAGRGRIARQMLTESLLLSLCGGAAGLAIGQVLVWGLQKVLPFGQLENVTLDRTTLWFTAGVSLFVGLLFGLAPALQALRVELIDTLKESGGKSSASRPALRGRQALVFCQVLLCTVLLAGSGLLVRTVQNLRSVEMGFQPEDLITAPMTVNADKQRDKATMLSYYEQALQRVRSLAGVSNVGITTQLPVQGQFNMGLKLLDTPEPDRVRGLQYRVQTVDTFKTLGMRIVRGRDFEASDRFGSQPVAIVNESFARRFGRDGDALGNRVRMAGRDTPEVFTIAGIVNDVRETGLRSPVPPVVYMLFDQAPQETIRVVHQFVPAKWVIRVQPGVNADLPGQIRREVGAVDPSQPFQQFETMQAIVSGTMEMERLLMALLGSFALLTLIMVASGLYGTLSYAVTQRRQEIGIRMAMGARWQDVVFTVSMSGAALVAGGVSIGLLASLWTAKLLSGFLFHVPAFDPWSMSGTAAVLLLVSLVAGAGPSWNAVRTDPLRALRVD